VRRGSNIDAFEGKVNPGAFRPHALSAFRELYPKGRNFLVSPGIEKQFDRIFDQWIVRVIGGNDILPEGPS
jgi:hypothetical protein